MYKVLIQFSNDANQYNFDTYEEAHNAYVHHCGWVAQQVCIFSTIQFTYIVSMMKGPEIVKQLSITPSKIF